MYVVLLVCLYSIYWGGGREDSKGKRKGEVLRY